MTRSEYQKKLSELRVAWFRGTITSKEVLMKTLDFTTMMVSWSEQNQSNAVVDEEIRLIFSDLRFHSDAMKSHVGGRVSSVYDTMSQAEKDHAHAEQVQQMMRDGA